METNNDRDTKVVTLEQMKLIHERDWLILKMRDCSRLEEIQEFQVKINAINKILGI